MQRRAFLTTAALGSTTAITLGSGQAFGQATDSDIGGKLPTLQWRMATSWPKKLDILFGGAETICRRVSDMTQGRFTITPYASGEIASGLDVLKVVSEGSVECGHTASYYYTEQVPALAFGTNVPFGLTTAQQNAWLYYGGGLEAMHKLYQPFNIINFPAGNTGVQMGGWMRRRLDTLADFQGLKMRIPGLGAQVMSRLGVEVKVLAADEIAPALIHGAIDAAEWNNPYDDEKIGLTKAAPYYYYPGWWEPGATYELQINQSQWDALPLQYQEALKTAAAEVNTTMPARYNAKNGKVLAKLQHGDLELVAFTPEIMQAAYQISFDLYTEYAAQDPAFRKIYEQWNQFRQEIYTWNRVNELSFDTFVMSRFQQTSLTQNTLG
ncbi:MAG: ABC transporter substrate-binding protein [Leptolyngbyaceae cyanobacterium MO_188.B28]|nr:ABC transporter substrate-binding protein [Leptolyngbyaceae cyanobacterium MO_188.B28]